MIYGQLLKMKEQKNKERLIIDYYIYLDYSETLVGYIIIQKESVQEILPKISKLHHYKDIKNKKGYIQSIRKIFDKNPIEQYLLKCRIKWLKDNLSIFVEIVDFVKKYDNCKIFASVDNNQFIAFMRLLDMIPHKDHITVVKESDLKRGSVEYKLSLIIDTKLNIEMSEMKSISEHAQKSRSRLALAMCTKTVEGDF